jgi:hypothetical protein
MVKWKMFVLIVWLWRISGVFSQGMMRMMPLLGLLVFLSDDWRTPSELYFRMKREVQSSIRVTPMPKLNRELPPRWRSPDSQVATASSVLYLAQSGWVMTPALLMTGSTDVQPVCSRPIVKIRNRIRISTSQRRLCVNWFKVLQQVDVHLIVPLFFQRIVNEKLIYNTNRFVLQELVILLGRCLTVKLKNWFRPFHFSLCQ